MTSLTSAYGARLWEEVNESSSFSVLFILVAVRFWICNVMAFVTDCGISDQHTNWISLSGPYRSLFDKLTSHVEGNISQRLVTYEQVFLTIWVAHSRLLTSWDAFQKGCGHFPRIMSKSESEGDSYVAPVLAASSPPGSSWSPLNFGTFLHCKYAECWRQYLTAIETFYLLSSLGFKCGIVSISHNWWDISAIITFNFHSPIELNISVGNNSQFK
jgi:hypothetical protein